MAPESFAGSQPPLVIEEYFAGETHAWGIVQRRDGTVARQFEARLTGGWQGDEFVLDEQFQFRDGERDNRTWRIRRVDDHQYEDTAADVVGVARGERYGQAVRWQYVLLIDVGSNRYRVTMDDWMLLQNDGVLIHHTTMKKFGFRVGELTLGARRI